MASLSTRRWAQMESWCASSMPEPRSSCVSPERLHSRRHMLSADPSPSAAPSVGESATWCSIAATMCASFAAAPLTPDPDGGAAGGRLARGAPRA